MPNPETENAPQGSVLDALKRVVLDGIDYFQSIITLTQARMTGMALSAAVFLLFLVVCGVLAFASFTLLTIAFGMWLTKITGHAAWALVILGGLYGIIALIAANRAAQWMKKLNS